MLETTGAGVGILTAGYATFGEAIPQQLVGWLPALPMAMLSLLELLRISLVPALFTKKLTTICLTLFSIIGLSFPVVDNDYTAFDRIGQMRVKEVVAQENVVDRAKADLAAADSDYRETQSRSGAKRVELRSSTVIRDQNIAAIDAQLKAAGAGHENILDQIRSACRIVREQCVVPRSASEDERYKIEVRELSNARTKAQTDAQDFTNKLDQLVKDDEAAAAKLDEKKRGLSDKLVEAEKRLREVRNDNYLYRFAAYYFRTSTADLTPSQIGFSRIIFAVVPALVCAFAGPLGAYIHYALNRVHGAPSFVAGQVAKLVRARRAYLARQRKSLPVSEQNMLDFFRIANSVAEERPPHLSKNSTAREEAKEPVD